MTSDAPADSDLHWWRPLELWSLPSQNSEESTSDPPDLELLALSCSTILLSLLQNFLSSSSLEDFRFSAQLGSGESKSKHTSEKKEKTFSCFTPSHGALLLRSSHPPLSVFSLQFSPLCSLSSFQSDDEWKAGWERKSERAVHAIGRERGHNSEGRKQRLTEEGGGGVLPPWPLLFLLTGSELHTDVWAAILLRTNVLGFHAAQR